ncbi:Endo-1,3(4)-beta-glucanase 1 [Hordeum vulgare]|nr:Endo-1,3(4)-beta-glucanase 1 [Hordeum vulgare]
MTLPREAGASYTRTFDLWKLHSWTGGLTELGDGLNQERTSEAVNAYYFVALLGLSYGDTPLVSTAATLTALEMLAAQTWWHIREGDTIYENDFTGNNRLVSVVWTNKRDSGLWFAPPEWKGLRFVEKIARFVPWCFGHHNLDIL